MPDFAPLRDLIYLDPERLHSLAAQSGLALSSAAAKPSRSQEEALLRQLEAALSTNKAVTSIGPSFDFSAWSPTLFRDGEIISVRGMVRLLDFPWLASVMETMPKMLKVTQRTELSALKQKRDQQQITQSEVDEKVKEHQRQLRDLDNWKMDELTEVVRELYGQSVRLKLAPTNAQPGQMFVGTCHPAGFTEAPAILSQKYGCDVDANWTLLGMANITPDSATPAMPTGNAIEDMFERLALAVNRIHRVASAPVFPGISVTPLAVYREI